MFNFTKEDISTGIQLEFKLDGSDATQLVFS